VLEEIGGRSAMQKTPLGGGAPVSHAALTGRLAEQPLMRSARARARCDASPGGRSVLSA
jgi:hypothetical protein